MKRFYVGDPLKKRDFENVRGTGPKRVIRVTQRTKLNTSKGPTMLDSEPLPAEIHEAAKRAGYTIRASIAPGLFDLHRPDGSIAAAGVSRENLEITAAKW